MIRNGISLNRRFSFLPAALIVVLGLAGGCRPAAEEDLPEGVRAYSVRGEVIEVRPTNQLAIIQHEEIPNYMRAMTMPFNVKDGAELEKVSAGDKIAFRLIVTESESWIDHVQVVEKAEAPPPDPVARFIPAVEPLEIGDPMINVTLTNTANQPFQLKDKFDGSACALTFIYTRCPLPDFCPRMSHHFQEVQNALANTSNPPTNIHLVTVSFDPEFDTPEVLRQFAQQYQRNEKTWTWATGSIEEIDKLTESFGLNFAEIEEGNFDHNLRTIVVGPDGRIRHIFVGNAWSSEELLEQLKAALKPKPTELSEN